MSRGGWRATATALVLLGAAFVTGGCGRQAPPASPDARTAVNLDAGQRAGVLTEMRSMLGSVDAVVRGVAAWDTAAIRAAALRSGTAAAADPALERILPADWMAIAMPVHAGFDSLAAAVTARGATREALVSRLGAIMPHCVQCHATYRLGTI